MNKIEFLNKSSTLGDQYKHKSFGYELSFIDSKINVIDTLPFFENVRISEYLSVTMPDFEIPISKWDETENSLIIDSKNECELKKILNIISTVTLQKNNKESVIIGSDQVSQITTVVIKIKTQKEYKYFFVAIDGNSRICFLRKKISEITGVNLNESFLDENDNKDKILKILNSKLQDLIKSENIDEMNKEIKELTVSNNDKEKLNKLNDIKACFDGLSIKTRILTSVDSLIAVNDNKLFINTFLSTIHSPGSEWEFDSLQTSIAKQILNESFYFNDSLKFIKDYKGTENHLTKFNKKHLSEFMSQLYGIFQYSLHSESVSNIANIDRTMVAYLLIRKPLSNLYLDTINKYNISLDPGPKNTKKCVQNSIIELAEFFKGKSLKSSGKSLADIYISASQELKSEDPSKKDHRFELLFFGIISMVFLGFLRGDPFSHKQQFTTDQEAFLRKLLFLGKNVLSIKNLSLRGTNKSYFLKLIESEWGIKQLYNSSKAFFFSDEVEIANPIDPLSKISDDLYKKISFDEKIDAKKIFQSDHIIRILTNYSIQYKETIAKNKQNTNQLSLLLEPENESQQTSQIKQENKKENKLSDEDCKNKKIHEGLEELEKLDNLTGLSKNKKYLEKRLLQLLTLFRKEMQTILDDENYTYTNTTQKEIKNIQGIFEKMKEK